MRTAASDRRSAIGEKWQSAPAGSSNARPACAWKATPALESSPKIRKYSLYFPESSPKIRANSPYFSKNSAKIRKDSLDDFQIRPSVPFRAGLRLDRAVGMGFVSLGAAAQYPGPEGLPHGAVQGSIMRTRILPWIEAIWCNDFQQRVVATGCKIARSQPVDPPGCSIDRRFDASATAAPDRIIARIVPNAQG
jgi:hypothetical protein